MKAAHKGFTLIETLIVIAILAIIAIIVLIALNPIEQINRGRDSAMMQLSTELYDSTVRMQANNKNAPWSGPLYASTMTSAEGDEVLGNIIAYGELKEGFKSANSSKLNGIYLSAEEGYGSRSFCFVPKSNTFKQHRLTQYTASGQPAENICPEEGCYLCINSEGNNNDSDTETPPMSLEEMTEEQLCENFDPEYPNFPYTTNFTSINSDYGCTGYSISDYGCLTINCPSGYRELRKVYNGSYATDPSGWTTCLLNRNDLTEIYCVPEPYAACDTHPNRYSTNAGSLEWGCTNPRRPMRWLN